MKVSSNSSNAGGAVIAVLLILVICIGLVGTALFWSSGQNRMAARQREVMESVAAADGALEYAYATWRDLMRANPVSLSNATINSDSRITNINKSGFSPAKELTETGNTVTLSAFTLVSTDPWGLAPIAPYDKNGYDVAVAGYPGWKGHANYYKATITATGPKTLSVGTNVSATVSRYFSMTTVPLFQAAI